MKIKICGLTRENDIEACIDAGIDYLGFNLLKVSKGLLISNGQARSLTNMIASKSVILIDDQVHYQTSRIILMTILSCSFMVKL